MQGVPNHTEIRVPTQSWSGYGFSHSSPSPIVQSRISIKEEVSVSDGYSENYRSAFKFKDKIKYSKLLAFIFQNTDEEVGNKSILNDSVEGSNYRFAASNYLDAAATSTFNVVTSSNYSDLPSHLASLGLQKYIRKSFFFFK